MIIKYTSEIQNKSGNILPVKKNRCWIFCHLRKQKHKTMLDKTQNST